MKSIVKISRFLVGILFIFSGLVKANDPLGLAYKMQEFFDVWAQGGFLPGMMHRMDNYALAFSVLIIAFEIIAGVAVLVGWRMRIFGWLLLLLILFFTFLTGYAYLSGKFRSCGCFGDCIPLSPFGSFIKDLILLVLILLIFAWRKKIKPIFSGSISTGIMMVSLILSYIFQWYVLKHLPFVDCLPFKVGNDIPAKMKIPAGAVPDSTIITFVYQKDGKEIEFTADHFPEDFDDSIYHFVKRYDKLIRKGNAEPPIKDFSLKTSAGIDTTLPILQSAGYKLFLFLKDADESASGWEAECRLILKQAETKNIPAFLITASAPDRINSFLEDEKLGRISVLSCDPVPIKTAARANPTLILLKEGVIIGKWSHADFDKAFKTILQIANNPGESAAASTGNLSNDSLNNKNP